MKSIRTSGASGERRAPQIYGDLDKDSSGQMGAFSFSETRITSLACAFPELNDLRSCGKHMII
jgi:hypothetical protein